MAEVPPFADAAAFVAHWARVGPLLSKLDRREQRQLSEQQHLQAVANVLALARPDQNPSTTSGLVELQRLFLKSSG